MEGELIYVHQYEVGLKPTIEIWYDTIFAGTPGFGEGSD
jgi:hypothetical protein